MANPMAIAAIATQGIKSAFGLGQAIVGGIRMKKLAKQEPTYKIPTEVDEGLNMAKTMAREGMDASSYNQATQQNQQAANFALRGLQDRRSGLAGISNIQSGLNRANLSLAAQDAQMRQQNQRFAYSALMTKANYRDKLFANQWQSWSNKYNQARALTGAGMQNIVGGADGMSAVAGTMGNNAANMMIGESGAGLSDSQAAAMQASLRNIRTGVF